MRPTPAESTERARFLTCGRKTPTGAVRAGNPRNVAFFDCGHLAACAECADGLESCPLCRRAISLYSTVSVESALPLRVPAVATIFGSTYLQGGKPGVAAYHFDAEADCYISYEHAPPGWRLDDGSSPPAKKPFLNPKYDPATRTFTGTIEWSEATINGGDARWALLHEPLARRAAGHPGHMPCAHCFHGGTTTSS